MKARFMLLAVIGIHFVFLTTSLAEEIPGLREMKEYELNDRQAQEAYSPSSSRQINLGMAWSDLTINMAATTDTYEAYFHIPVPFKDQVPILIEVECPELIDYRFIHLNPPNILVAARLHRSEYTTIHWEGWVFNTGSDYSDIPDYVPIPTEDQLPDSVKKWLVPTDCVQLTAPIVQATAAEIRDTTTNLIRLADDIAAYCHEIPGGHFHYPGGFSAAYTLKFRGNSCTGKAHTAAALFRANGIPARSLLNLHVQSLYPICMHWIVDYFAPGYGWINLESSMGANPQKSQHLIITFVANPEDEFPSITPCGMEGYWHSSDQTLGMVNPDWCCHKMTPDYMFVSKSTIPLARSLTDSVFYYYSRYWGIDLTPDQDAWFQSAYAFQQDALTAIQHEDMDTYIVCMEQALHYYRMLSIPPIRTLFFDDFEADASGWSHGGQEDEWELGSPAYGPPQTHSGTRCWGTDLEGTYENNADTWLVSPEIDLANKSCAYLSFWAWLWVEDSYWAGGYIESEEYGDIYDPLWLDITTDGTMFYPLCSRMGGVNDDPEVPAVGGWTRMVLDLTRYTGNTVRIRFRFQSNEADVQPGAYIDDVHVYGRDMAGCTPRFTAEPTCGNAPLKVHFTDQTLEHIISWQWDFDGDGIIDSEEQHPVRTYDEPGLYTVRLDAFNGENRGTFTREQFITVFDGETALQFNGYNSSIVCPASPILNVTEAITIEAWINPENWGEVPNMGFGRIIDKETFRLFLHGSGGVYNPSSLVFEMLHENGSLSISNTGANSITLGEWQHVAVTYDGNDVVHIFIDGKKQQTTHLILPSGGIGGNGEAELLVGDANTMAFRGALDEIRIWNIPRSGEEIADYMDAYLQGDEPGLIVSWRMNEGNGEGVSDQTAYGHDGTLVNTDWIQGVRLNPPSLDGDGDGIVDTEDNCLTEYNPEQEDTDADGLGNVCDNCVEDANPDQTDADNDGAGDACDECTDTDDDGYGDPGYAGNTCDEDNCPETYNPDQTSVEQGDINCKDGINVLDVLSVVNHILGTSLLVGAPLERADCGGDGNVNILDALGIINVILGIGECAPHFKPTVNADVIDYCAILKTYLSDEGYVQFMTLVKTQENIPNVFHLSQNYPNPFNAETDIRYQIPALSRNRDGIGNGTSPIHISLILYNLLGHEVRTLVDDVQEPGHYIVTWDGKDNGDQEVASGIYFYRLMAGDTAITRRMVLMK